jgi:hypothetical protein
MLGGCSKTVNPRYYPLLSPGPLRVWSPEFNRITVVNECTATEVMDPHYDLFRPGGVGVLKLLPF